MYLRHSVRRKDGKKHVYWRLVRSVRRNGKVIQETVAQLGELDAEGRAKAKSLAREITGRGDQLDFFEDSAGRATTASVRLDRVRVERGRSFGDVWLAWRLWQALRLDELCEQLLPLGREQVPWSTMAVCRLRTDSAKKDRVGWWWSAHWRTSAPASPKRPKKFDT